MRDSEPAFTVVVKWQLFVVENRLLDSNVEPVHISLFSASHNASSREEVVRLPRQSASSGDTPSGRLYRPDAAALVAAVDLLTAPAPGNSVVPVELAVNVSHNGTALASVAA